MVKKLVKKSSPKPVAEPKNKWEHLEAQIQPIGDLNDPMVALLYGRASTGKTVVGATFPKPLLIMDIKERGTESISRAKGIDVVQVSSHSQLEEFFWYLKQTDKYRSVTIDHCGQWQQMVISELRTELAMKKTDNFHKGQWGQVSGHLKEWMLNFRDLRDKGMNVCFVAHDRQFGGEDTEDNAIDPSIGPGLMPSVASFLNGAVSVIGNTFIRERFEKNPKLPGKKTRIVEYCMRVGPHASYVTKIRKPIDAETALPDIIVNPSYEKLIAIQKGEAPRKTVSKPVVKK